jgi:dihydroorotase
LKQASKIRSNNTMNELTITQPDDWHLHLRDGEALQAVVQATAAQFARAVVMPNLKPPVITVAQANAYRDRILKALPAGSTFEPLMTLYLTDNTSSDEIAKLSDSQHVHAVKLYPAGATTNSDAGVSDLKKAAPALEAMQRYGVPLLIHGEVTDQEVDLFDREAMFIDTVLQPLRKSFPALRVVFEHITTEQAAHYVRDADDGIAATITAQHLLYNRNAIFKGGVRPHWYCLPVLKREKHRAALLAAAVSGNPRYFLGTDSAPHAQKLKEHAAGCAGCYTAPHAMELYAAAFEMADKLDKLEGFASFFGPDFYKLPRNTKKVVLRRAPWQIPDSLPFPGDAIVPLAAGEQLNWRLQA